MYLCKFGQNPPTGSELKSVGKADIYSLYRMVTLKIRSMSPKSNPIIQYLKFGKNESFSPEMLFCQNLTFQSAVMTLKIRPRSPKSF